MVGGCSSGYVFSDCWLDNPVRVDHKSGSTSICASRNIIIIFFISQRPASYNQNPLSIIF